MNLSMRAASLSTAALLVAAAVLAAVTMRVVLIPPDIIRDPPPIWVEPEPEPPKPSEELKQPRAEPLGPVIQTFPDIDEPLENTVLPMPPVIAGENDGPRVLEPVRITRPHWLEVPSNLADRYPDRALQRGREGVVQLECRVPVNGRLDCVIASETPAGWGFGEAALGISRDYRMVPATRDGIPVEGVYRLRVPFNLN